MPSHRPLFFRLRSALPLCALLAGCAGPGYYLQAIQGQFMVMHRTRSIDAILRDPASDPALNRRLTYALTARAYASHELALPDNRSYRRYADLQRPYVTWTVHATPELSLKPLHWCFPVAGCVDYRGYFSERDAQDFATRLRQDGHDVYVAGVDAYSTLGWFSDPLPSPVLRRSDVEVAGVIFHELAHQELYLRGDSTFNESFATTVEIEGVRRWLQARSGDAALPSPAQTLQDYVRNKQRHEDFIRLLLKHRARLQALYDTSLSETDKRAGKARILHELKQDYLALKSAWGGYGGYDRWFEQPLNNARLSAIGLYHGYVPAFQSLLAAQNGDLPRFYAAARQLSRLPARERADRLRALDCAGKVAVGSGDEGCGCQPSL
jgi:predicted aminopeptidase